MKKMVRENTAIEGLRFSLEIIENLELQYKELGYKEYTFTIESVIRDIKNEIGQRAFKNWKLLRG